MESQAEKKYKELKKSYTSSLRDCEICKNNKFTVLQNFGRLPSQAYMANSSFQHVVFAAKNAKPSV